MAARRTTKKAAAKPVEEPEIDEVVEDEEFEEVDQAEETDAPAKTKGTGRPQVDFGIRQVCDILSEKTGKDVTPRELRVLARKLAKDQTGRIDREIVAGNRSQYSWSGANDPEVKALIKAFMAGEGDEEKKAKLAALKESSAAKRASSPSKPTPKKAPAKKKAAAVEEEVYEDDEELDLEDED
jgi:hypothetical protein